MTRGLSPAGELPRLSRVEVDRLLEKRELEDLDLLERTEAMLRQERGHVLKMPPPGTPVLMLFSGGLDTTIIAAYLLEIFGLEIHPVYVGRKHTYEAPELKAVAFWTDYFAAHHRGCFHEPLRIEAPFPSPSIRWAYEAVEDRPVRRHSRQVYGDPFYSSMLCMVAAQAAYHYEITKGVRIRTLVSGFMPSDGEVKIDFTLTTLRATSLTMCLATQDFDWQVTAIPLERELGFFYDKEIFIRWGDAAGMPLEKTRSSCKSRDDRHCGACLICDVRRFAFKRAGVADRTVYAAGSKKAFVARARRKLGNRLTRLLGTFAAVDPWSVESVQARRGRGHSLPDHGRKALADGERNKGGPS